MPGAGMGKAGEGRAAGGVCSAVRRGRDGTGREAVAEPEPGEGSGQRAAVMGKLLAVALVGIAAALAVERLLAFR